MEAVNTDAAVTAMLGRMQKRRLQARKIKHKAEPAVKKKRKAAREARRKNRR